jgi:DNA-binding transcriptional ArsR family regulator
VKLQQVIASSCRQKILVSLSRNKETYITKLVRDINSTYNQVDRNLRILEMEGIVKIERYGHMRAIKLNRESSKTIDLLKALKILESSETASLNKVEVGGNLD